MHPLLRDLCVRAERERLAQHRFNKRAARKKSQAADSAASSLSSSSSSSSSAAGLECKDEDEEGQGQDAEMDLTAEEAARSIRAQCSHMLESYFL